MVKKQASPPIRFEIGSARNTPVTPISGITGSKNVSGTTMMTFLNMEKKIACFYFPSA